MAKNNYIKQMIDNYGDSWITALKPEDIQRAGKRIVKEIVKGDFDYQLVGGYFLDLKFLDNLIISVQNELDTYVLYYNAVAFYRQYNPNLPNIGIQENHLAILCHIYTTILNKLKTVKSTGNIGWLADTSGLLYSYRNHLN
jgi:hypothetical protein